MRKFYSYEGWCVNAKQCTEWTLCHPLRSSRYYILTSKLFDNDPLLYSIYKVNKRKKRSLTYNLYNNLNNLDSFIVICKFPNKLRKSTKKKKHVDEKYYSKKKKRTISLILTRFPVATLSSSRIYNSTSQNVATN